jgi:hypothetical protein
MIFFILLKRVFLSIVGEINIPIRTNIKVGNASKEAIPNMITDNAESTAKNLEFICLYN